MSKHNDPLLLDHDYDGIQELDNPLPKWWLNLFYITCIFAVGYIGYFWFGPGLSIEEQFALSMKSTEQLAKETAQFDYVNWAKKPESISNGKAIFDSKCASCHRTDAGGLIGPNLTDDYWIHGDGSITAIVKVVTEGVAAKGMIAWGPVLKQSEIAEVTAYVLSLKGSNPNAPKSPEGTKI
jgi:cytochrome c oxidase cbb3-type subunit 3